MMQSETFVRDEKIELYCDVLLLYLLVESSLGDCEFYRELDTALESGDPDRMAACLKHFQELPEDLRATISDGDVSLESPMDSTASSNEVEASDTGEAAKTA